MDNRVIYYSEQIPITGGAYLPPGNTYIYLNKAINVLTIILNIVLIGLLLYFAYLVGSLVYKKYKEIVATINDTNNKVNNINDCLQSLALKKQKQEIASMELEPAKKDENEEEKIYIVDEDGTVIDSKKTEE